MIKKIFGFLKKSLKYILLLAVIAFLLIGGLKSCGKVSASAEAVSDISTETNYILPWENVRKTLFDYDYENGYYIGLSEMDSREWKYSNANFFIELPAGTYYIMGMCVENPVTYSGGNLYDENNNFIAGVSIRLMAGTEINSFTLTQTTKLGLIVKSFRSSFRIDIRNTATSGQFVTYRQNPYEQGYNEGYDSGKLVGQQTALNGIFANATISGSLEEPRVSSVNFDFGKNFNFVSGGIDFNQFISRLETIAGNKWGEYFTDHWSKTHFDINLAENVPLNQLELFGQGNSMSFSGNFTVTDVDGNIYRIGWTYPEFPYKSVIPNDLKNQNILIKKISFDWGGGVDGIEVTIFQQGLGYESGYANGYNDGRDKGYNQGKDVGYKNGYTSGVKEGESVGYEKAVSEGVSGSGLLYGVFVLLKLFFKLITDLLSLKIAGDFTIGIFLIGIPATFMIINQVIKLVKNLMSAGGGKSDE